MLIATGNHQYSIPLKAMITGKNIGWQISTSDMSEVQRAVGVRPGDTDKNALAQIPLQKRKLL
jgi:hypothetical protein